MSKLKKYYEVRLNKNVVVDNYGKSTYKKGRLITSFDSETHLKMNLKSDWSPCECVGHGNYNYFKKEDVEIIEVTEVIAYKKKKFNSDEVKKWRKK